MRDITFGQYYPIESVVHRLDARTKILLVVAYIVMVFLVPSFVGYGIVLVFIMISTILARVPIKSMLRSIRPILYIMIFTVIMSVLFYKSNNGQVPLVMWWRITIYKDALLIAGRMACRLVLLVIGPTLLTLTTTPVELTDGLEFYLKPLALVRFPVQALALIMSIALRFIPTLVDETDKIVIAQKSRCADFDSKNLIKKAKSMIPVLIPLFVSSFRRADELADAIDSRCYGYTKKRTRLKTPKLHIRDLIAVLVVALFVVSILIIKYQWIDLDWIYITRY